MTQRVKHLCPKHKDLSSDFQKTMWNQTKSCGMGIPVFLWWDGKLNILLRTKHFVSNKMKGRLNIQAYPPTLQDMHHNTLTPESVHVHTYIHIYHRNTFNTYTLTFICTMFILYLNHRCIIHISHKYVCHIQYYTYTIYRNHMHIIYIHYIHVLHTNIKRGLCFLKNLYFVIYHKN